ncbi:MAG TPA: VOC family protein [Candidatus Limnocylindrales bacterium]
MADRPGAAPANAHLPVERATGIGGVFLRARDRESLGRWYVEHLGLAVEADEPVAVFRWGATNPDGGGDGAADGGSTTWALFPDDTAYFGPGGQRAMLNYRVADLDRMLAQLRAAGVEVDERVEDHPYGRFGWAVDPEGNRFELWEPAPGS